MHTTSTGTPTSATNNDLPIETQLAVGTLQLAGSEQDISAEQAEELKCIGRYMTN